MSETVNQKIDREDPPISNNVRDNKEKHTHDAGDYIPLDSESLENTNFQKYTNLPNGVKNVIQSFAWRANLLSKDIPALPEQDRAELVIANYVDTIFRNLPDIDPTLAKNLLAGVMDTLNPSLLKASTEIEYRYEQTGKFEGYNHPDIKAILEKHMQSAYRENRSWLARFMKVAGTPIHEIFGQQKYAEGESAIVAKNVHTAITRAGNCVAGGLFLEGMVCVTNIPLATLTSVLLYLALQVLNEYTNEVEHTTKEKRKREYIKRVTKWTTILAAKSVPLILTAVSAAAITTPKLHQEYLTKEGSRLKSAMIERAEESEKINLSNIDSRLVGKIETRDKAQEILNKSTDTNARYHADVTMHGGKKNGEPKIGVLQEIINLEEERSKQENITEVIGNDYAKLGAIGFLQKNYQQFFGEDLQLSEKYHEAIKDYEKLAAGVRFENGIEHMTNAIKAGRFNDEILMRVWIAVLFESLSLITLVAVQARADYRKVVTNSDAQSSLGQIVEGSIELQRQLSAVSNHNHFIVDEDKKLAPTKDKRNEFETKIHSLGVEKESKIQEIARQIRSIFKKTKAEHSHQPPSYSSLVNSLAMQQIVKEMFREGQIPAFNQIVLDISRDLIHPIPNIAKKPNQKADKEELAKQEHDQKIEADPRHLINIPGYIIKGIEDNVLSNAKDLSLGELAANLSIILSNHMPEKDDNKFAMDKELDKHNKKQAYHMFINRAKDLNSDVQDIIDTNGASQDRVDLKNAFKDQLRSACKQYYEEENYENAPLISLKDLVDKVETQEKSISLNSIRVNSAKDFITKRIEQNTITPSLLSQIVSGLRSGDIVIVSNISRKDKRDLEEIKKLHLSSPYEASIEALLFKFETIANKYSQNKTGLFNTGWFGREKFKPFQNELRQAIAEYIQASNAEIQSKS
jgi:hypothetical protein